MLTLGQVLSPEDLERVRAGLARAPFRDGRATAGPTARKVKRNQQAVGADPGVEALAMFVREALQRHPVFSAYARPVAWSRLMFSKYGPGDTYEGGALLLDGLDGEREHRPQAGDAVLYATGRLHRVTPVTSGERLAAVGWLQSLIRRDDQRELLFDLERVRAGLADGEGRLLLDKSIGNLLRQWGEI